MFSFNIIKPRYARRRPKTHRSNHRLFHRLQLAGQLLPGWSLVVVLRHRPTVIQAGQVGVGFRVGIWVVAAGGLFGCGYWGWPGIGHLREQGWSGNLQRGTKNRTTNVMQSKSPSVHRETSFSLSWHADAVRKGICKTLFGLHIHLTQTFGSCFNSWTL